MHFNIKLAGRQRNGPKLTSSPGGFLGIFVYRISLKKYQKPRSVLFSLCEIFCYLHYLVDWK